MLLSDEPFMVGWVRKNEAEVVVGVSGSGGRTSERKRPRPKSRTCAEVSQLVPRECMVCVLTQEAGLHLDRRDLGDERRRARRTIGPACLQPSIRNRVLIARQ